MDIGLVSRLVGPLGTVIFNEEFDTPYGKASFLMQKTQGMDGAGVRNPITIKPLKSGAIIHKFKRAPRIFSLIGELVADNPSARWWAQDLLRGVTDSMTENNNGTFYFTPPVSGYQERYLTVRQYDAADLETVNYGVSGPKEWDITLIAGDWRAYSSGGSLTTINDDATGFVANGGNTEAWLVFNLHANGGDTTNFILRNEDTGFEINWDGSDLPTNWLDTPPLSTRVGFIDMLEETFFISGGHDAMAGISFVDADFFSVAAGGATIGFSSDNPSATITVDPLDAWV